MNNSNCYTDGKIIPTERIQIHFLYPYSSMEFYNLILIIVFLLCLLLVCPFYCHCNFLSIYHQQIRKWERKLKWTSEILHPHQVISQMRKSRPRGITYVQSQSLSSWKRKD